MQKLVVISLVLAVVVAALWLSGKGEPEPSERSSAVSPPPPPAGRVDGPPPSKDAVEQPLAAARAPDGLSPDFVEQLIKGAPKPSDVQLKVAQDFHALYGHWDQANYEALFAAPSPEQKNQLEERIEWFRNHLGDCGTGKPLTITDAESARFVYECEKGQLEAGFSLDPQTLRVAGVAIGARNLEPEKVVHEAALNFVSLLQEWNLGLFELTFSKKYQPEQVRRFLEDVRSNRGICRLGESDLVSARGGLFALNCEQATRLLRIELDDNDQITQYQITAPRAEAH